MGWSGGSYSKGNAGTGGWTGDASLGIGIEAGRHDTQDNDFATGINQCLNKDGSNSCTGDLNLGGFKPVNVAAGTAAAPAICAGGDVNTGIFSAAADQIGIATNGTERVRINATGDVDIGGGGAGTARLNVAKNGTACEISFNQFSADQAAPQLQFYKSRGVNVGDNSIVASGDSVGNLRFFGANGTSYDECARIRAIIDGTPGASNDMPGRIEFFTRPDGAGSLTERMRIASSGYIGFGTSTNVGNYTFRVNDNDDFVVGRDVTGTKQLASKLAYDSTTAFGTNLVIEATGGSYLIRRSSSSIKYKENIIDLDPSYADKLHQFRPVFFRSKCYSDNPHYTHYGFIAEELAQIEPRFVQFGYKPEDYEEYTYTNQDGEETTGKRLKPDAVGEPEGVQYDRIVTFLTSIVQRQEKRIQALEAKIAELEVA